MKNFDAILNEVFTADEEELKTLVHHPSSRIISKILMNQNLSEDLALIIARRKNIDPIILESIYNDVRWKDSYRIKLTLCRNPKTPQRIGLSIIKTLKIIDLADLTRNKQVPINVRTKAEDAVIEKIISLPLGIKIALARKASSNVLVRLIEDGMREVVKICLDSSYITEGNICAIVSKKKTTSHVIHQIAHHPKWSRIYNVQRVLILNNHTPLIRIVDFLKNISTSDLRDLYSLPAIPSSSKPFIYRELQERGVGDQE
ncbi:MAG: hypothetical protein AB1390_09380 [Nitrospirota bacterium]